MADSIDAAIATAEEPNRVSGDIVLRKHSGGDPRRVGFNMPEDLTETDLLELVSLMAGYMPKFLAAKREQARGGLVIAKTLPGRMS